MDTNPGIAHVQSLRFLRWKFGHVAADLFHILCRKRERLCDRLSSPRDKFYYFNKDLVKDFGSCDVLTAKYFQRHLKRLQSAGLIEFWGDIHPRYGSVVYYQIKDEGFKALQLKYGSCWKEQLVDKKDSAADVSVKDIEMTTYQPKLTEDSSCDPIGYNNSF